MFEKVVEEIMKSVEDSELSTQRKRIFESDLKLFFKENKKSERVFFVARDLLAKSLSSKNATAFVRYFYNTYFDSF